MRISYLGFYATTYFGMVRSAKLSTFYLGTMCSETPLGCLCRSRCRGNVILWRKQEDVLFENAVMYDRYPS